MKVCWCCDGKRGRRSEWPKASMVYKEVGRTGGRKPMPQWGIWSASGDSLARSHISILRALGLLLARGSRIV